jgi:hypothetical protein
MNLDNLKNAYKTKLENKDRSQDGENRIVNFIFKELNIIPKYAVEFGSGQVHDLKGTANISWFHNKYECECLFFESNPGKIRSSLEKFRPMIKIEPINAFNINDVFEKYDVPQNLDIVVIDVDGQDYWIWEKLEYEPKVVVIEFNPQLSPNENKVMHYDPDHWQWRDSGCGYCGASLGALKKLGNKKGYSCVFRTRRNLIFVQKDLVNMDISNEELYNLYKGNKEKNNRTIIKYKNPKWVTV